MKNLFFILFISLSTFAQIERVEPPFWYADMNLSSIQIMFYGKNIAQYDVAVSNKIKILEVKKVENPNYIFVTIDTKNAASRDFIFSFSTNKKTVFIQKYSLKTRIENSRNRKSFDASDLIYLVIPDR